MDQQFRHDADGRAEAGAYRPRDDSYDADRPSSPSRQSSLAPESLLAGSSSHSPAPSPGGPSTPSNASITASPGVAPPSASTSASTSGPSPIAPPRLAERDRQYSSDSFTASSQSHNHNHNHGPQQAYGSVPPPSGSAPSQPPRPSIDQRQSSSGHSIGAPTVHSLNSMGNLTISGQSQHGGHGNGNAGLGIGVGGGKEDVVHVGFDEGILRGLCEMDCALPLLADRIKQSIASCKQVAVFFRSRAEIEEKYARSLVELTRTTGDVYARADCKAGSFVLAYQSSLKVQDQLAHNRIRLSQRLNEMSDELLALAREGEKMRKQHKDNGQRYQGMLQESETAMEKAKSRFDSTAEELERLLVAKEGESFKESGMRASPSSSNTTLHGGPGGSSGASGSGNPSGVSAGAKKGFNKAIKSGGMLFKGKGPASIAKQEDDTRARMAQASETFRKAVLESQGLRQEYFNFQLPKILRLLKECADELDMGTQYHLTRYAFLYETAIVGEGQIINPMSGDETLGLKQMFETIDNRNDFKHYMQNYAVARGAPKGPRREGPYEDGFLPPLPPHVSRDSGGASTAASVMHISSPFPSTAPLPSSMTNGISPAHSGMSTHSGNGSLGATAGSGSGMGAGVGMGIGNGPMSAQSMYPQNQGSGQYPFPGTPAGAQVQAQPPGQGQGQVQGLSQSQSLGQGQGHAQNHHLAPGATAPPEQYAVPGIPASSGATFGVDLGEQLGRDGVEVPRVVEMCAKAIEEYGLENTGIYRLSGTTSKVQALKRALDTDIDNTDVMNDEWSADINVVSGALKLWFRELPEPLLTFGLYDQFIAAARHENDRLRQIRLHEQVNELPDPNYATLKFFMGHLDRIRRKESVNQMSTSNLSIVFGPTLLGAPPEQGGLNLEHMSFQCKAIETILDKYGEIFVEEDEAGEA